MVLSEAICDYADYARHELGQTFYQPTVISGINEETVAWREETFGPVASLTVFDDEDEAIERANDTMYGLLSYVYTHDLGRVFRVSEAIETGMVAVNTGRVSNSLFIAASEMVTPPCS